MRVIPLFPPSSLFSSSLLFFLLLHASHAIKCKCTKESETVQCEDGSCTMEGGACLMLDHPTLGVHYTCHTRSLQDKSCRKKTSKSGAAVNICGCESEDFCNYKLWPEGSNSAPVETTPSVNGQDVASFIHSFFVLLPLVLFFF